MKSVNSSHYDREVDSHDDKRLTLPDEWRTIHVWDWPANAVGEVDRFHGSVSESGRGIGPPSSNSKSVGASDDGYAIDSLLGTAEAVKCNVEYSGPESEG